MTAGRLPARFYAVPFAVEGACANLGVALPLWLAHEEGSAGIAGALLALLVAMMAVGTVLSAVLPDRLTRRGNLLVLALALVAAGHVAILMAPGVPTLAAAAVLDGLAAGFFWVGSQRILARTSGAEGSERGFLANYVTVVVGGATGSLLTGVAVPLLERAGARPQLAAGLSLALGGAFALAGLALWWPARRHVVAASGPRRKALRRPLRGLRLQWPDIAVIVGLGLLLPLGPVVLTDHFHLSPLTIGAVAAAVYAAKISGVGFAATGVRLVGGGRTTTRLLYCGAVLLAATSLFDGAGPYIVATILIAVAGCGAWPLLVDAGLARVPPQDRGGMTTLWTARQYIVMAAMTASTGAILSVVASPQTLVFLAAIAMAAAAVGNAGLLRRPVHRPDLEPAP